MISLNKINPKVCLDTNVLCSAVRTEGGLPRRLVDWWLSGFLKIYFTKEILNEYLHELNKVKVEEKNKDYLLKIKEKLQSELPFELCEYHQKISWCRDKNDNKFLECSLYSEAEVLISKDKDLLSLKSHPQISSSKTTIQDPEEFFLNHILKKPFYSVSTVPFRGKDYFLKEMWIPAMSDLKLPAQYKVWISLKETPTQIAIANASVFSPEEMPKKMMRCDYLYLHRIVTKFRKQSMGWMMMRRIKLFSKHTWLPINAEISAYISSEQDKMSDFFKRYEFSHKHNLLCDEFGCLDDLYWDPKEHLSKKRVQ
ncbi:MAG: putative toxin-antitoxin system toxin component, PIN family [Deltaproteobacteria bacterium]|nr:MAG: putative toxin-antitoxin system toxin component, PIN family [Deltaproteobacteria bacterium]